MQFEGSADAGRPRAAIAARPASPVGTSQRPRLTVRLADALRLALLVGLGAAVLYPLAMVVISSVRDAPPGTAGSFTLQPWAVAFTSGDLVNTFLTTLRVAVPSTLLSLTLATALCWVIARTNTPRRSLLEFFVYFMWIMPGLPTLVAWILLASPRSGYLNLWLGSVLPFRFNVFTYESLVFLSAVYSAPFLFVFLYPAFLNMDTALEEAAQTSGAGPWARLRFVVLPLLLPALLSTFALALVLSLESFEAAQLIGTPAGIFVFTNRLYDLIYMQVTPQFGAAAALAMVLLGITLSLVAVQRHLLANRLYTTITGKGYRPRAVNLGPWRWVTLGAVLAYVAIFGLAPLVVLVLNSFLKVTGFFRWDLFTLDNWREVLTSSGTVSAIANTLTVAVCAATLGVAVVLLAAYVVTRTTWRLRTLLETILWLPIAVPTLILALGFLWAYVALPIYGTLAILVFAVVVRGLPTSSRFFVSTMVQISNELEEAARAHGASWLSTFLHVLLPLLRPAIVGAWVLLFLLSVRTLDLPLILGAPQTEVLSVAVFRQAEKGKLEIAAALGLVQMGLAVGSYLMLRFLARSAFRVVDR